MSSVVVKLISLAILYEGKYYEFSLSIVQDMRRITTFRSTTDRIYDGGPINYNII